MIAGERIEPAFEEVGDVVVHARHVGMLAQPVDHWSIAPGERAQRGHVMRVGQHAHVEHVVGVQRHAALEGEGFEDQRERALRCGDQRLDIALQLGRTDDAGVDHVGAVAQVGEQFTFEVDGMDQQALLLGAFGAPVLARQGMAPA